MKTKPHHPLKRREEGGDLQVVQECAGGGTFNCYALLMAKTMSTTGGRAQQPFDAIIGVPNQVKLFLL